MKKTLLLLICLCVFLPMAALAAEAEEVSPYQYDATTLRQFYLRPEPDMETRQLKKVPKGSVVNVVEYGDEWCLLEYKGKEGYAKRKYLFKFHSHDPHARMIPGYEKPYGTGTMTMDFNTKGMAGKTMNYGGNDLMTGDQVTVHTYDAQADVATILVWRTCVQLPKGAVDVQPFVDHASAQPGDLICAYSTYTSEDYGYPRNKQRRHNMQHAINLLQGAVVQPGEVFSFNSYAAPYTKANGYQKAPTVGGKGVGYGGGACQITTMTYGALLGLPFRVNEHVTHTDEGVSYALQVCDATVSRTRDLKMTSLLDYPVRLEFTYKEGTANIFIYRHE